MPDFDQERYTTAMLSLGFARGLISRLVSNINRKMDPSFATEVAADVRWLDERIERVMQLNDEA